MVKCLKGGRDPFCPEKTTYTEVPSVKKLFSLMLALSMALSLCVPAYAHEAHTVTSEEVPIYAGGSEEDYEILEDVAKKNNSDLVILNDPDGDRLGIAIKFCNSYKILTALEIAALFLNFIIETKGKDDICVIKSIVSCGICEKIIDFIKLGVYKLHQDLNIFLKRLIK